jgi:hypothetical protein
MRLTLVDQALQEHFIDMIVLDALRHFLVKVSGLPWSLILDHYLYNRCPCLLKAYVSGIACNTYWGQEGNHHWGRSARESSLV